jgi:hypothetical protein
MMGADSSGVTLGARTMAAGAKRALALAEAGLRAVFDADLAGARALALARTLFTLLAMLLIGLLDVFFAVFAAAARAALAGRAALLAECLLMFVNIAVNLPAVGSFLTNLHERL